jgi:hypothetical protein
MPTATTQRRTERYIVAAPVKWQVNDGLLKINKVQKLTWRDVLKPSKVLTRRILGKSFSAKPFAADPSN